MDETDLGDPRAPNLLDGLLEGCQLIDRDFRYVYLNDAAAGHGRSRKDELVGRTMMDAYPGIESTPMFRVLRRCLEGGAPAELENRFTFADGSDGWFELRFRPVSSGVFILSVDITARKRAEEGLRRAHRALTVLSHGNQTLVRARSEPELIETLCRVIVSRGGYGMAWVAVAQGTELRAVGSAGGDAELLAIFEARADEEPPSPSQRAVEEGRAVVVRFSAAERGAEVWRREASARGYHACLAAPLRCEGRLIGALNIFAHEAEAFDARELELLEELALDLGFGIATQRGQVARRAAEQHGRTLEQRLRGLTRAVQDLSAARRLETICDVVRHAARDLVGSDGATFVLREGDECCYVDEDAIAPLWKGRRFPLTSCISGWVMLNGQGVIVPDVFDDARVPSEAYTPTFVRSLAMVPIGGARPLGAIGVYWAHNYTLPAEQLELLQALADATSTALDNMRVYRELEESDARSRATCDHLPSPLFVWRRAGSELSLVELNAAARRAVGAKASELIGLPAAALDEAFPGLKEDLARCLAEGTVQRREALCRYPGDTQARQLVLSCGPVPPDTVVLYTEDVSEARLLEERARAAQRLEAVGQLAGGVAHDFNNLLSVIISYATLALEGMSAVDPRHDHLVEVCNAGDRAAKLTRQLLAFSRRQVMQTEVMNLNSVISGVEGMLRRLLGENIDIAVSLREGLGNIEADRGQLEQVLMNLVINARDAMPSGGRLTIETANVVLDEQQAEQNFVGRAGPYALLSISDTGTGMSAETRARIFEPFFTTKGVGEGTGLGLSTAYGIVKQTGGHIGVLSELGLGSTFRVYLPTVAAAPLAPVVPVEKSQPTGHETVLLVEDDESVRRLVQRILGRAGYTVLSAANGAEALALCEAKHVTVDLLLTDVVMPAVGGRELAERLRASFPKLRVLFMSGYTDTALVQHGMDANVRFIAKPFSAAELTQKVRAVLDRLEVRQT